MLTFSLSETLKLTPIGDAAPLALLTRDNWQEYKFPSILPRHSTRNVASKRNDATVDVGSLDAGSARVLHSMREQFSRLSAAANSLRAQPTTEVCNKVLDAVTKVRPLFFFQGSCRCVVLRLSPSRSDGSLRAGELFARRP